MACPARGPEERRRKLVVIGSLTEWRSWETGNVSKQCRLRSVEMFSDILTSFSTANNVQFPLLWTSRFLVCRKENWTRWSLIPLLFRWFHLEMDSCFYCYLVCFLYKQRGKINRTKWKWSLHSAKCYTPSFFPCIYYKNSIRTTLKQIGEKATPSRG